MVGKIETSEASKTVTTFDCTKCGAPVKVRAVGMSLVCVCGSCQTVMDALDERHQIISKSAKKNYRTQYIELGTRGKLKGSLWEVIGYMEKTDNVAYQWSEYLLFNPAKGFRWLSEYGGHWNYIVPIKNIDSKISKGYYGGKSYALYHNGDAFVLNVVGEFYWRVEVNDFAEVWDFVKDDEILSSEKTTSEVTWTIGEYLAAETVKTAFKIDNLPTPEGVAPNQPNIASGHLSVVSKLWTFFMVLIIMIQLIAILTSQNKVVSTNLYSYVHPIIPDPIGVNKEISTPAFSLNDESANVEITVIGNINNSWLYAAGSLVNVDTGEAVEFDQGIEYYSGYDSDGSWSEGSRAGSKILDSIPGGNYQLNFEVSGDKDADYKIQVRRDVVKFSNFLWAIVLLSLVPLFLLSRRRSFEMNRWSQSDFSPYQQHHDE